MAVGDGAAGKRSSGRVSGLVLLRLRARLQQALGDFVRVAGRIPLPPRFAFGAWWSRYWAYSDQELDELVRGFHENDVPLDVLVIDMDWHISREQLQAMGEKDQSGHGLGWSGYTWNKTLFPDPDDFLKKIHEEGLKTTLNLHPASGIQPWETGISGDGEGDGHRSGNEKVCAVRHHRQEVRDELHEPGSASAGEAGHRLLVARLAAGADDDQVARREPIRGG